MTIEFYEYDNEVKRWVHRSIQNVYSIDYNRDEGSLSLQVRSLNQDGVLFTNHFHQVCRIESLTEEKKENEFNN